MTITEKMYLSDVFSLDNKVVLSTISSQSLVLIKIISYFIIINLLTKRAVIGLFALRTHR